MITHKFNTCIICNKTINNDDTVNLLTVCKACYKQFEQYENPWDRCMEYVANILYKSIRQNKKKPNS